MSLFFPTSAEMGHHTIFPGVQIHTCAAEKMMLSVVDLATGSVVAEHSHPHEQVGIVLAGRLVFTIGGETKTLGPGEVYRIPGGVKHAVQVLENRPRDPIFPQTTFHHDNTTDYDQRTFDDTHGGIGENVAAEKYLLDAARAGNVPVKGISAGAG